MRKTLSVLLLAASMVLCGCATQGGGAGGGAGTDLQVAGDLHRASVCIGLTAVEPAAYEGWAGDCPGADVDAKGLHALFVKSGFSARLLLNEAATWPKVCDAVLAAAKPLSAGDLLAIAMSGHGGQLPDDNGDEADKQDETICLWDGQVRDDAVLMLLQELPPGIRIVLISDQCHSEGNFRALARVLQRGVSLGKWGKKRARPIIGAAPAKPARAARGASAHALRSSSLPLEAKSVAGWSGPLIQFAGCREAEYSYGAPSGGTWSQSLLSVPLNDATRRTWFDAGAANMPGDQVPVWVEYGDVPASFRNGPALQ